MQVWRYPFPDRDGKEATDPHAFYYALGVMDDGFFPLGVNGFPHGGVHFGERTSASFDQSAGVGVIANGEIVAFRLDDAYPQVHFTQDRRWGMYSTGFVLVRHQLTMPAAPGSTTAQPADETLTFFSLYMHMADWATYLANGDLVRPGWWPGVDAFRIGNKDRQTGDGGVPGAFVYQAPKAEANGRLTAGRRVALLPEGCEVTISERRGEWAHIHAVTSGHMVSAQSGGYFGWEDERSVPWVRPDGDENREAVLTPEGDWGWIHLHDQRAMKEPQDVGKIVVPPQPIHVKAGTLLGQLGEYHDYERSTPLPPVPARQLLHLEVFAGDELKTFIDKSRMRAVQLPPDQGATILLVNPGAKLVGRHTDPDLKLGEHGRISHVVPVPDSPQTGPWMRVQPWRRIYGADAAHPDGGPVWVERYLQRRFSAPDGMPAWSRFPLQLSAVSDPPNGATLVLPRAQLDSLRGNNNIAVDDKGVRWWFVGFGTADGKESSGWICENGHPGTKWENPWAWPGFEIVDASGINLTDAFRRNLLVSGNPDRSEQSECESSAATVNNSVLLRKLEHTLSRRPPGYNKERDVDKNGRMVVTARKLAHAMYTPWLASEFAHLILRYESEWGGNMNRWEAITPLMRNAAENWRCELTRIRKLQWWDEVKGRVQGFPSSPVVHHVHPVALVGNFATLCTCVDIDAFCGRYKSLHATEFGWFSGRGIHQNISQLSEKSEQNLRSLLSEMMRQYPAYFAECRVSYLAYMLATVRIESYDFRSGTFFGPILEMKSYEEAECDYGIGSRENSAHRDRAVSMGNTQAGDGYTYRGRGLVQLTFKKNYQKMGKLIGLDLVNDPDKALELPLAVKIMMLGMRDGIFAGPSLSRYLDSTTPDYVGARAIINGQDKASQFAYYAERFEKIIKETR